MPLRTSQGAAKDLGAVPIYKLYGDPSFAELPELVHCESIIDRSKLHNWEIKPHRHDDLFQLFYLSAGSVRARVDERSIAFSAPAVLIVPSPVVHGFSFTPPIDGWVVTLPEASVERLLAPAPGLARAFEAPNVVSLASNREGAQVGSFFERIAREYRSTEPSRYFALDSLLGLVLLSIGRLLLVPDAKRLGLQDRGQAVVREFHKLVERRFKDHEAVSAFARDLGLTPTHLNRLCRGALGKSALQVLHDRLMLEAKRNLIYTTMTIAELSYALGFSDPSYFSRFFLQRAGMSPKAFRKGSRLILRGQRGALV